MGSFFSFRLKTPPTSRKKIETMFQAAELHLRVNGTAAGALNQQWCVFFRPDWLLIEVSKKTN